MKKTLYAFGDSNTDPNFVSKTEKNYDCSFPKWPELVAAKLDMNCQNLGHHGKCNYYIIHKFLDTISTKDDIGAVMFLFTSPLRHPMAIETIKPKLRFPKPGKQVSCKDRINVLVHEFFETYLEECIDESIKNFSEQIKYVEFLCLKLNIPYVMAQGFTFAASADAFTGENKENLCRASWIKHFTETEIEEEKCIGWPWDEKLGGYTLADKFAKKGRFTISARDPHPNAQGHELIAQEFYDRYSILYE